MTRTCAALLATLVLLLPGLTIAENEDQPTLYVSVDCMKAKGPGYPDLERELWQPMHQERVMAWGMDR